GEGASDRVRRVPGRGPQPQPVPEHGPGPSRALQGVPREARRYTRRAGPRGGAVARSFPTVRRGGRTRPPRRTVGSPSKPPRTPAGVRAAGPVGPGPDPPAHPATGGEP